MIAVTFAVGTKVTVITTPADPIELCLHPHTIVAEVEGRTYLVEHPGGFRPRRFGPFDEDRLIAGWTS